MHSADLRDLIVGGVTIAFACIVMIVLIPFGVENPGKINVLALGPAFWPFVVAIFLFAMGLLIGGQAIRRARLHGNATAGSDEDQATAASELSDFTAGRWAGALVLLAAYYLLLNVLGMVVTSALALVSFMVLGGERRPVLVAALAIGLPLVLFLFFRYVANVVIPLGIFGSWIE